MHSVVPLFLPPLAPPHLEMWREHGPRWLKNSQVTGLLWATLPCLLASPEGNWERSSALDAPLSTEAAGMQGLWSGEAKRGGFSESHPVPQSSLPAPGLCDLELEEAGLGCSSRQPVSLLPPGGPASERTLQEHPRSGGCPRQEVLGSWVSIFAPWGSPPHCRTSIRG